MDWTEIGFVERILHRGFRFATSLVVRRREGHSLNSAAATGCWTSGCAGAPCAGAGAGAGGGARGVAGVGVVLVLVPVLGVVLVLVVLVVLVMVMVMACAHPQYHPTILDYDGSA